MPSVSKIMPSVKNEDKKNTIFTFKKQMMKQIGKSKLIYVIKIIFHVIFWIGTLYVFLEYSYTRPLCNEAFYKEVLSVLLMAIMVYLNYFILIPFFLNRKRYVLYFFSAAASIMLFALGEYFLVKPEIIRAMPGFSPEGLKIYLNGIMKFTLFRYVSIFSFFCLLKLYESSLKNIEAERQLFLIKDEHAQLEKEYLKSRISPVYLLNVVSSLQAMAITKEDKLPEDIGRLAYLLNYYINYSVNEKIFLSDEMQFYRDYLQLIFLQRNEMLALSFIVQDIPSGIKLEPLLFEPIIFNAYRWVNQDATALMKFQFSFQESHILIFESKSSIKLTGNIDRYIQNDTFDKLNRRLQSLYPSKFTLTRKITGEYIVIKLSINIAENK